ncbi:hypothetical protein [Endozoicomonas sp. SCSIO W0465]|uniref:hypothetical protein n=1 Tax=Endozoicomonas sp. SCSIO W0465 TaxID=2918516 RepID=UPI002075DE54|nr:hypothetical protein [Endozoicomonas sp. SCSIO W0465]USE37145.1 hypothetical protein MJO57_02625 [Endozoicomonas sp. SCSIO W0465]
MIISSQRIDSTQTENLPPLLPVQPETNHKFIGRGISTVSVSGNGLGEPVVHTFDRKGQPGLSAKEISVNDPSVGNITKKGESFAECGAGNKLASSPFVINPEDAPFTSGLTLDMLTMPPELASLTIRTKPSGSLENPTTEPFRTFPSQPFDLTGTIAERFDQVANWDEEKNDPTTIIAGGVGHHSYSTLCQFFFEDGDTMTPSDILRSSYYLALNRPTISASYASIDVDKPRMGFWYSFGYIYEVPSKNIFLTSPKDANVPMLGMLGFGRRNKPGAEIFRSLYRSPNPLSSTEVNAIFDEAAKEFNYPNYKSVEATYKEAVYCKAIDKREEELLKRETFGPKYNRCCTREEIGEWSSRNEIAFYPNVVHEGKLSQAKIIGIFFCADCNYKPKPEDPDSEKWPLIMQHIAKKLHLPILDLRLRHNFWQQDNIKYTVMK